MVDDRWQSSMCDPGYLSEEKESWLSDFSLALLSVSAEDNFKQSAQNLGVVLHKERKNKPPLRRFFDDVEVWIYEALLLLRILLKIDQEAPARTASFVAIKDMSKSA